MSCAAEVMPSFLAGQGLRDKMPVVDGPLALHIVVMIKETADPLALFAEWYGEAEKTEPNPDDFEKQKKTLTDTLLQQKRAVAYDAFRSALDERLKQEGKVKMYPDKMRGFGTLGS